MSQPDSLRAEFESFRDSTRRELREVRTLAEADDSELANARANTRMIQALRETQLEQGAVLDAHTVELAAHGRMLRELATTVGGLVVGQDELKTDVAGLTRRFGVLETDVTVLKSDVSTLKSDMAVVRADVDDLKGNVAGILRILDERLPPKP